jgi:hypothetical protein
LLLRLFRSISTAFAVVFFLKFSFFLPFHISLIQKAVLLMDKSDGQWIFEHISATSEHFRLKPDMGRILRPGHRFLAC